MRDAPKATSAGPSTHRAISPGRVVRGAFAIPARPRRIDGRGAPFSLALLVAVAAFIALAIPASAAAAEPTLSVDPVTVHGITTAKVTGTVSFDEEANGGSEGYWYFQYCEDASPGECTEASAWTYGPEAFSHTLPAGSSAVSVEETLTGLKADTEYTVRLAALPFNTGTEVHSEEAGYQSFTTDPAPVEPTAAVKPATGVEYTTAQLQGSVNPEGGNEEADGAFVPIHWTLELERSAEPGEFDPIASGDLTGAEAESHSAVDVPVTPVEATSLTPGHLYHYRLAVTYAGQSVEPAPEGEFTTLAVTKPTITNLSASNLEPESAHLSAEVDPNGTDPAFDASWSFQCSPECGGLAGGTVPAGPQSVEIENNAKKLEPNTEYTVTLTATNAGGESEATTTFTTPAAAPGVQTLGAGRLASTEATLDGAVNPRNSSTTYWFEWGTADCAAGSCQAVPASKDGDAGSGGEYIHVAQPITGLSPQTTYHFRLVAENPVGTTPGPDRAFTTPAVGASGPCPNEAIREEQHSTFLPECRAYEVVSPPDKNGNDISGESIDIISSRDGNAVEYRSRGSYGDTVSSGPAGQTGYVARRGTAGWSSHAVTPLARWDVNQVVVGGTSLVDFSDDLSHAVVWGYDLPEASGALPQSLDIYAEDTATRALQLVTVPGVPISAAFFSQNFRVPDTSGVSRDSRHIAFNAPVAPLLAEAPPGVPSVYQWDEGTLRLASILPDGTPASAGAKLAYPEYREDMSPDGSRVLFASPPYNPNEPNSSQLYMRVDHQRTVEVSESENPAFSGSAEKVILQQVTGDSRHVIFDTTSPLLEEDENNGPDLYLYTDGPDPKHENNLTLISHTGQVEGDGVNGTAVIGSSDDADRIYYYSLGHILLWKDGITTTVADSVFVPETTKSLDFRFSATATVTGGARVSPDGRYLVFYTGSTAERSNTPVAAAGGHKELYLYDAVTDSLRCVSCPTNKPATADARIDPNVTDIVPRDTMLGLRPTFLADNGKVFFSTTESLVPEDVNDVLDAYEFDPATGRVVLLSTGKGSSPATFASTSASGNDTFIVTRQQLVKADTDSLVDLYDVRVGGDFPEPQSAATPCSGDACQETASIAPEAPSVSSDLTGPRNRHPARCARNRRRVHRNGKTGCGKEHRKRHANHNRRSGR